MSAVAMTKEFLTIDDVAEMLNVHRNTVQSWIQNGELPAFKLGQERGYRIARTDLNTFLQNRRVQRKNQPEGE